MDMTKTTYSFLQLREYLKNLYKYKINNNKNCWSNISSYISEKTSIGIKTIESALCTHKAGYTGRLVLEEEEALKIAECIEDKEFKRKFGADDETGILQLLIKEFLKAHGVTENYKRYYDLPVRHGTENIILKNLKKELDDQLWKNSKFVFLQGFHDTGKNFAAFLEADGLYNDEEVDYAFFIDCHNNKVKSPVDFYKKILFSLDDEDFDSLQTSELSKKAINLLSHKNSVIYIEAFESIEDVKTQKHIIEFLSKYNDLENHANLYVIITSSKRSRCFPFIDNNQFFAKSEIQRYSESGLKEYFEFLKQDKEIQELCQYEEFKKQDIEKFLLEKTTNLGFLKRSLLHIARKIKSAKPEEDIESVIKKIKENFFKKEIYDFRIASYNYLEELNDNSLRILVALLLVSAPLSKEALFEIACINSSEFNSAFDACYDRFFINEPNEPFSIADEIKPLVVLEYNRNYEKYNDVRRIYDKKYNPLIK